jgi:hypothetical protein
LLLEQVELRRRAKEKFTAADRMFFTRVALQQATDEWVAQYKASRLIAQRAESSPTPAIADLCCGIGGDLIALSAHGATIGVDRDPVAAHFAEKNLLLSNAAAHVRVVVACAEDSQLNDAAAWHIDPDRRATGRRTTSLDAVQPSLETIKNLLARVPHAAIKLAPATRVPPDWAERCELEWISRDGECRQLVAWHGQLARTPGFHRATIINSSAASRRPGIRQNGMPGARLDPAGTPRTIAGQPNQPVAVVNKPGSFIFDIDPAIRAAHLQGALAAERNLSALATGPGFLTGNSPITDASLSCFKIEHVLPLRKRVIAQHLREDGIGQLEIKKRGVEIDPEKLRRDLKLCGNNAATLLITRIADQPAAIVAQRI